MTLQFICILLPVVLVHQLASNNALAQDAAETVIDLEVTTKWHDRTFLNVWCAVKTNTPKLSVATEITVFAFDSCAEEKHDLRIAFVSYLSNGPQLDFQATATNVSGTIIPNGATFHPFISVTWDPVSTRGEDFHRLSYKCVANGYTALSEIVFVSKTALNQVVSCPVPGRSDIADNHDLTKTIAEHMSNVSHKIDSLGKTIEAQERRALVEMNNSRSKINDNGVEIAAVNDKLKNLEEKIELMQASLVWLLAVLPSKFETPGQFRGKMYLVTKFEEKFNIDYAQRTCQEAGGGYLVELNDQEEFHFVRNLVRRVGAGTMTFYTGTNDLRQEGYFEHMRSRRPFRVSAWFPGEPDGHNSAEDCVELRREFNYLLNDHECDTKGKFVCEVPLPAMP